MTKTSKREVRALNKLFKLGAWLWTVGFEVQVWVAARLGTPDARQVVRTMIMDTLVKHAEAEDKEAVIHQLLREKEADVAAPSEVPGWAEMH